MKRTSPLRKANTIGILGAIGLSLVGVACKDLTSGDGPTASSSANPAGSGAPTVALVAPTGDRAVGSPLSPDKVAKVVNPKGEQPYSGPAGTLKGVVRIKGDPPLPMDFTFPPGCGEAAATYGKLFRTGQDNTLADVMVTVTGYEGYVPAREPAAKMTIHGCALAKRTMAVAFGQRIEVANIDKTESYMPYLDGAPMRAILVAVPGGDPVRFYPQEPGHYLIRDQLPKPFMTADVYVVAYATHDVTGLDGQYSIPGIPAGKVRVNAFLPAIDQVTGQDIEIKPGDNTLDLTIEFNRAEYDKKVKAMQTPPAASGTPSASPSASPSAKPSASPSATPATKPSATPSTKTGTGTKG